MKITSCENIAGYREVYILAAMRSSRLRFKIVSLEAPIIKSPRPKGGAVKSLADFLEISGEWHSSNAKTDGGMLSDLWYRGVNRHFDYQAPGVYRNEFTTRAELVVAHDSIEGKRLRLERDLLSQFRGAGAAFLSGQTPVQLYFTAQHFGMPTRLLDWSTNPLAALFFACDGADGEDGFVYAMDAKHVIPEGAVGPDGKQIYRSVMSMRHRFVQYSIGRSFWEPLDKDCKPYVIPIRPDAVPGRIGQQSSCFTFHSHLAAPVKKPYPNRDQDI